jgi:hypothetical protein
MGTETAPLMSSNTSCSRCFHWSVCGERKQMAHHMYPFLLRVDINTDGQSSRKTSRQSPTTFSGRRPRCREQPSRTLRTRILGSRLKGYFKMTYFRPLQALRSNCAFIVALFLPRSRTMSQDLAASLQQHVLLRHARRLAGPHVQVVHQKQPHSI